ncbi:MAG: Palmitoyltransferase [Cirrosporium novae-zelandiae]|nr:MAG: Palmitoyltransferase [Cirrosporium novae-zelandiae]
MDPQYLGPSVPALIHLFILIVLNSFTLFMLSILLVRSIWSLAVNTTTIEGWEIERHETLVRRARYLGGYLDGPDGKRIRIQKQEFPYDIGIWQNIKQGMGTSNVLAWLWPFASTPSMKSGLSFEINGFEDENLSWPPPDPDRVLRIKRAFDPEDAFTRENDHLSEQERINAFRQRQGIDFERRTINGELVVRQKTFAQRYSQLGPVDGETDEEEDTIHSDSSSSEGEEGWRTADGERLRDFGVDEEVDFYDEHDVIPDEDDIPLAELMRRRGIRK